MVAPMNGLTGVARLRRSLCISILGGFQGMPEVKKLSPVYPLTFHVWVVSETGTALPVVPVERAPATRSPIMNLCNQQLYVNTGRSLD